MFNLPCCFKSGSIGPLLLLCRTRNEGILSLKEIKNDIIANDINVKYNFIIKPVNINENITVFNSYNEAHIFSIYPSILDFTSKDNFNIYLFVFGDSTNLTKFSFNEKEDLKCEKFETTQRCTVPKKHFEGKNNGYYYIKYYNKNLKNTYISYITNPVSVILPKKDNSENKSNNDNKVILVIAIVGSVVVILIIAIAIYICIFKKKNTDLKEEVLKTSFKEEETQ